MSKRKFEKMDPVKKAAWVAALRSGDFSQTTNQLVDDLELDKPSF